MKKTLFFLACLATLIACSKDGGNEEKLQEHKTGYISGFAQKGYLVEGSQITAFAFNNEVEPTGESFPANIKGCLGGFSIMTGKTDAAYFELRAEGYYFDEVTGCITNSPIYLEAFAKSTDTNVNLNIFTTIIKGRIKKLILSGKNYDEAKTQAQVEFYKTVNLAGADIDFTQLDLTGGSDADAMLLLTTCAIQHGRTASELMRILQKTASEFEDNGTISEDTSKELFQPGQELDFRIVFKNLWNYYDQNGLSKETLPSYWKYFGLPVGVDFKIISSEGFITSYSGPEPPADAQSGKLTIASLVPFNITADVDWITFEKKGVARDEYEVKVNIAENTSSERRVGHLIFTDENSRELDKKTFTQGPATRILILEMNTQTKGTLNTNGFASGDKISVNGIEYTIQDYEGRLAVYVPNEESYTLCYPAERYVQSSYYSRVAINFSGKTDGNLNPTICGAISAKNGIPLSFTETVKMVYPSYIFEFTISGEKEFEYLTVTLADKKAIAGLFEFPIYPEEIGIDPNLKAEIVEGDLKEIMIVNSSKDGILYAEVPPTASLDKGITVTVFDEKGDILFNKSASLAKTPQMGTRIRFNINLQ